MKELFRRYVLHNFGLKILSLLLATGLWMAISPENQPAEMALRVPIEFHQVPDNIEISSANIPEAQVRVRGPDGLIRQLRSTDVHAEIDLADVKPGERTFDLTSGQIHPPRDVSVVQVLPGQVHLDFDTRLSREVEVHARVTGNFVAGEGRWRGGVDDARSTSTWAAH